MPADVAALAADDPRWRRTHPASVAVEMWLFVIALVVAGFNVVENILLNNGSISGFLSRLPIAAIILIAFLLVSIVGRIISWRIRRYAITDDAVHLVSGLITRSETSARLDRVQSVDIRQPLAARVIGMAKVTIEVTGGIGSGIELAYFPLAQAKDLREQILRRAAYAHHDGAPETHTPPLPSPAPLVAADTAPPFPPPSGAVAPSDPAFVDSSSSPAGVEPTSITVPTFTPPSGPAPVPAGPAFIPPAPIVEETGAAPFAPPPTGSPSAGPVPPSAPASLIEEGELIVKVPPRRAVVAGTVRSIGFWFALVWVLGFVAVIIPFASWETLLGSLFGFLILTWTIVQLVWRRIKNSTGFEVRRTSRGLRLRHGLTDRTDQVVTHGRVQGLVITQPPLWRGPGWWQIEMNVPGYFGTSGEDSSSSPTKLLPVATHAELLAVIAQTLPDWGAPGGDSAGDDPRWILDQALAAFPTLPAEEPERPLPPLPPGAVGRSIAPFCHIIAVPRRARWFSLLEWRRIRLATTERVLVATSGFWWRRTVIIPHEKSQGVSLSIGPIQRKLQLASPGVHLPPGPASMLGATVGDFDDRELTAFLGAEVATSRRWRDRLLLVKRSEAPSVPGAPVSTPRDGSASNAPVNSLTSAFSSSGGATF
ncbi:MAG: PH domain-containing protein [Propionibacteriaceae bacterium]|jgi:putative membrane protein|nr:PH domain-containing protein [Propionibacteriaceae bacterium]